MQRPTILIGYGSHGHIILRDLLKSSSMRGLLNWVNGEQFGESRHLENVKIFFINADNHGEHEVEKQDSAIFTDLFNQIIEIKYDSYEPSSRTKAINIISEASSELRSIKHNRGTDALEVFFIAKPEDVTGDLATLDEFMRYLIEQLNINVPNAINQAQNSETLNFVGILDYKSLNQNSYLHRSLNSWESQRINRGLSYAYGRIYVLEEKTPQGLRSEKLRQKEIILFLEFLLFENNQQNSEFASLYKAKQSTPILSAFGIRLGERNIEQLSRSAAINFSKGWLNYIINQNNAEAELKVVPVLNKLDVQGLLTQIEWDSIEKNIFDNTEKVISEITDQNNISAIENIDQLLKKIKQIETEIAHQVSSKLLVFREDKLIGLKQELYQAITYDLCDAENRVTLHDIKQRIKQQIEETSHTYQPVEPQEEFEYMENKIRDYYRAYAQFINQCVSPQKSQYICWIFALLLAMGFTPSIDTIIQQLDLSQFFNQSIFGVVLFFLNNNFLLSKITSFILAFVLIGLPFIWLSSKYIQRTVKHSNEWYTHKYRGRLIHALRQVERKKIVSLKFLEEIKHSLITEIQQILIDAFTLLDKRDKEIAWLTLNLHDFQIMLQGSQQGDVFYHCLQNPDDELAIKNYLPPTVERYKGKIPEAPEIFRYWESEYNNICLNPLEFIDFLSKNCKDAYYHEQSEEQGMFISFLNEITQHFCVGVNFPQQENMPASDIRYALISKNLQDERISQKLEVDLKVKKNHIIYSDHMKFKIYLLIVKQGISPKVLNRRA